jgi:putative ABC transport system permease protein
MNGLRDDFRHALRIFWNAPSFAAAAVLTLALGIGVNIAVFTVMHSALLAGLPVKHAKELVNVFSWTPKGGDHTDFSYPLYVDLRDNSPQLDGLAAYTSMGVGVASGPQTERVIAELVTANYFQLLGVDIPLGPGFSGADELKGAPPVAVISPRLWQSMFDGDGSVIGKTLQVNGLSTAVVGVAPSSFTGFTRGQRADMWVTVNQFFPLRHSPEDRLGSRESSWMSLVGRTRPGAAVEQAQAQMTAAMRAKENADGLEWSIRTSPAGTGDTSLVDDLGRPLNLLMLVVGLILVIAAANVANLLLTRAYTRQREIAMRTVLGASRARIIRQLLIEGAVLSGAGGVVGLFLGVWTAALFDIRTTGGGSALALSMEPDAAVVAFTAVVSALAAISIGILPALGASRTDLVTVLKGAGEAVSGAVGKRRVRTTLTVVQIALSLVLVVGAGLFLRSLGKLRAIDPSLVTDRVIATQMNLTLRGYDRTTGGEFYGRLLESIQAVPGVQAATLTSVLPVTAGGARENLRAGATVPKVDVPVEFDIVTVSPGYFATLGVPLVSGRDFAAVDAVQAAPVAIVNESMKQKFWPDGNPVGSTFSDGAPAPYTVVGVARDTKYRNLREKARMVMYLPLAQSYRSDANLVVRTAVPPAQIVERLRAAVRAIDPGMPLYNVRTLAQHVDRSLYLDRLRATLIGSLALLALALAAIGIYAVLSYTIAERTREMGVRLALGAQPRAVLRMLLATGARVALMGITAGLILSAVLTRFVATQLYGLSALDPVTMASASALLFGVALLASFIPAWRATRIDPIVALRQR